MRVLNNCNNIFHYRFHKNFLITITAIVCFISMLISIAGTANGENIDSPQLEEPIILIKPAQSADKAEEIENSNDKIPQDSSAVSTQSDETLTQVKKHKEINSQKENETNSGSFELNINTLENLDPDSIGVRSQGRAKISYNLWNGAKRELVDELLSKLPKVVKSQATRSLAKKILMAPGMAPVGSNIKGEFLKNRIVILSKLEEYDAALDLLRSAPGIENYELAAKLSALQSFKEYDLPTSCDLSKDWNNQTSDPFWRKTKIFCTALEGNIEAAVVSADLMRETLNDLDPFLQVFLDTMAGGDNKDIGPVDNANPFQIAMLKAAGLAPPISLLESRSPSVLHAFIESGEITLNTKLQIAERAAEMGLISSKTLGRLYRNVEFTSEQLANSSSEILSLDKSLARALLYQVILQKKAPVAHGIAIAKALKFSMKTGYFHGTSRILLPQIQMIEPKPLFSWFAPSAIRSLLAVGEIQAAKEWYSMILTQIVLSPENASIAIDLWPLIQIADPEQKLDQDMLKEWWSAQQAGAFFEDASALLSILSSLGHKIENNYWFELLSYPTIVSKIQPSTAASTLLKEFESQQRIGEVALLGILIIDADDINNMQLETTLPVIKAFLNVGLKDEARSLALKVALKQGF